MLLIIVIDFCKKQEVLYYYEMCRENWQECDCNIIQKLVLIAAFLCSGIMVKGTF